VQRLLKDMPFVYADRARGVLEATLQAYKREMVARSTSGPIYRQTGKLARSWGPKDGEMATGDTIKTLSAYIATFSDTKALRLEQGGTVYPKGGQRSWIFIPTDNNRKFNGTAVKAPATVLKEGGRFYNRTKETRAGQKIIFAVIQGKTSLAWNLLLNANDDPMFIMTKSATYQPMLGFMDAGEKHVQRIIPRLADLVVDYWRTAA
jgi:hypothetical protein